MSGQFIGFRRGISERFLGELLEGCFADICRAVMRHGLDLQIRQNYIDIYQRGNAVLKLRELKRPPCFRAEFHEKYLRGVSLPDQLPPGKSPYVAFDARGRFVEAYVRALPQVMANAKDYPGEEGAVEGELIRENCVPRAPVVFIDRQVQAHGVRKKADLLGLTRDGVALVELKQGLDTRIQRLMEQVGDYHGVLVDDGRLRHEVSDSYRKVVAQKKVLGFLPDDVAWPEGRPAVECLIVLYAYNPRSQLLDRLRRAASCSALRTSLVLLSKGEYAIPPPEKWKQL